jgi:hypothetical protein
MNIKTKLVRSFATALGLVLLGFALATNAIAANYRVKIYRIGSESASGDVIIHIKPGTNETEFTGKARVMLLADDPGTNRAMATLLTATSMGVDVIINVPAPPSFDDIQVIISTSLIVP